MIPIQTLQQLKDSDRYDQIMMRSRSRNDDLIPQVRAIMQDVQMNGDDALCRLTKQFDAVDLNAVRVAQSDIIAADAQVSKDFLTALNQATRAIQAVQKNEFSALQSTAGLAQTTEWSPGIKVWRQWRPIETVGVYVPGGNAVYPSSVLMNVIPAQVVGCQRIVIVTPPQSDGMVSPYVLAAARALGIDEIYMVGGAQAIAGLTYGTESIPKVDKIVGPGNSYVATAKLLALSTGEVAIDSPAGPSEVLVLADETANPTFVAADLICDTEHGDDSAGVLVTTSRQVAEQVRQEFIRLTTDLSTAERVMTSMSRYGSLIVTENLDEAITFVNSYAAEHALVHTKNARQVAERITNAGSVFIGPYTCKSVGDYATGANHVLPTGGGARRFSALSVYDFMKFVEYQEVTAAGLARIRTTVETLAKAEGLPGHIQSSAIRFNNGDLY